MPEIPIKIIAGFVHTLGKLEKFLRGSWGFLNGFLEEGRREKRKVRDLKLNLGDFLDLGFSWFHFIDRKIPSYRI